MKKVVVVLSIILILAMGAGVVSYFSKGFADWQPFQPLIDLFTPAAAEVAYDGGLLEEPITAWVNGGEIETDSFFYYSEDEIDLTGISEESIAVVLTCTLDGIEFVRSGLFEVSEDEGVLSYSLMGLDSENPIFFAGEGESFYLAGGWFDVLEMPEGATTNTELNNRFVLMVNGTYLDDHIFEIIKLELAA